MDRATFQSLLDAPSAAALTTYRKDDTAATSAVWFRSTDTHVEVVIAESDVKVRHLERRPACSLLIFETVRPFRGIRIETEPSLTRHGVAEARLAISTKYLGDDGGRAFTAARGAAYVLRLPLSGASTWDLADILPA